MRWPIRNQILLPLVAVALVSLTAVGAINTALTERRTREHVEQQLRQVIEVLTTSSFPLTNAVLRQMRDLSSAEYVLTDSRGATSASTLQIIEPLPEKGAVARIQDVQLGPSLLLSGRWYFHTPVKLPIGSEMGRSGMLHVLFPQDEYRKAWRQAFVPSFAVGAVASLLVAGVACSLANRMGRTIGRLREEVLRIARGDFRQVALPAIDDEIRDLSVAVNRTAEMLADYEKQVRRSEQMRTLTILGASIAHQLRNAATGCRMALDLHADECGASGSGECLDVARQQLQLMESQLQRFLRVGKNSSAVTFREVELVAVVEDLLPLVRPAAQHAGVALDCRIASGQTSVRGDEEALCQLFLNLLLNSVEAAQQHGLKDSRPPRVNVDICANENETIEIIVSDSGAGPSATVAESLFEPFVTNKSEGAGLGLAVAKDVVVAHGGSIEWRRENGMTQFRVCLPLMKNGCASVQNSNC
ncbi:MAG TPA: HAMP domain-containing sensor histidine kinase [Lacipirellulaceae bacterium]|nr:HAMP domain-containing sensor histidine kinase [Lacipirellulaceae bacterium]